MNILIFTETFDVLKNFINQLELKENLGHNYARFSYKNRIVDILISGYGGSINTYAISKAIFKNKYDIVIHIGQCYSLKDSVEKGQLVCIIDDYFGDLGIGDGNTFASIFDLEKRNKNEFPFNNEIIENNTTIPLQFTDIRKVSGITCNSIPKNIQAFANAYIKNYPDVISSEAANTLYVCQKEEIKLIQLFYVVQKIEMAYEVSSIDETMIQEIEERIESIFEEESITLS